MKTLDPGHRFEVAVLDGAPGETAIRQYVKRIGDRYPGNMGPPYPGTIMQEDLRAIIERAEYVLIQTPCAETEAGIGLLKAAILLFEIRAKRVKGKTLDVETVQEVIDAEVCPKCGHVLCHEHAESAR